MGALLAIVMQYVVGRGLGDNSKGMVASKTFLGLGVVLLTLAYKWAGWPVPDDPTLQAIVTDGIAIVGLVIAAYGRIKATKKIG